MDLAKMIEARDAAIAKEVFNERIDTIRRDMCVVLAGVVASGDPLPSSREEILKFHKQAFAQVMSAEQVAREELLRRCPDDITQFIDDPFEGW